MWMKLFTNRAGTDSSGLPFHRGDANATETEHVEDGRREGSGEQRAKSGVPTKQIKFESNADGWHRCTLCILFNH